MHDDRIARRHVAVGVFPGRTIAVRLARRNIAVDFSARRAIAAGTALLAPLATKRTAVAAGGAAAGSPTRAATIVPIGVATLPRRSAARCRLPAEARRGKRRGIGVAVRLLAVEIQTRPLLACSAPLPLRRTRPEILALPRLRSAGSLAAALAVLTPAGLAVLALPRLILGSRNVAIRKARCAFHGNRDGIRSQWRCGSTMLLPLLPVQSRLSLGSLLALGPIGRTLRPLTARLVATRALPLRWPIGRSLRFQASRFEHRAHVGWLEFQRVAALHH